MKQFFQQISLAFKGELIKKRKSAIFTLSFIFGSIIPIIYFVVTLFMHEEQAPGLPQNFYVAAISDLLPTFASFFLIILIIINASKISQIDHKINGWQLMDVLPLHRTSIYFSKYFIVLIANALALSVFLILALLCLFVLQLIFPQNPEVSTAIPLIFILQCFAKIFLGSLLLTTSQFVFSIHFAHYIWSLLIGFLLYIITSILSGFDIETIFNPITLLYKSVGHINFLSFGPTFIFYEKQSLVLSVIVLIFGWLWFLNKGFKRAYFGSKPKTFASVLSTVVIGFILFWYTKPTQISKHHQTVISGVIDSDFPINTLYFVDPSINDTLAQIAVKDNEFKHIFTESLPFKQYHVYFNNISRVSTFMTNQDSIFINYTFYNQKAKEDVLGSRLAENLYLAGGESWNYTHYQIQESVNLDKHQKLQKELLKEYQAKLKNLGKFRTSNHQIFRDDFKALNKSMLIVEYLNWLSKLQTNYQNQSDKDDFVLIDEWQTIKSSFNIYNEQLLGNQNYVSFLNNHLVEKDTTDRDINLKLLYNISKIDDVAFKDKLLYSNLYGMIEQANNNDERLNFEAFINKISDTKFKNILNHHYLRHQNLGKGNPAFVFAAVDKEGKLRNIEELKGQVVVIDFWATWCGPCLIEKPFFEKLARKYQNDPVTFLAISLDENKDKWLKFEKNEKSKVKSWIGINQADIKEFYQINGIPRFVLIDKEGNHYQANFARPSEPSFETILDVALGKTN